MPVVRVKSRTMAVAAGIQSSCHINTMATRAGQRLWHAKAFPPFTRRNWGVWWKTLDFPGSVWCEHFSRGSSWTRSNKPAFYTHQQCQLLIPPTTGILWLQCVPSTKSNSVTCAGSLDRSSQTHELSNPRRGIKTLLQTNKKEKVQGNTAVRFPTLSLTQTWLENILLVLHQHWV